MPRTLTPAEKARRAKYKEVLASIGQTNDAVAKQLGVRRECISKRCGGQQPVTVEALLALQYLASAPPPEAPPVVLEDEEVEDLLAGL